MVEVVIKTVIDVGSVKLLHPLRDQQRLVQQVNFFVGFLMDRLLPHRLQRGSKLHGNQQRYLLELLVNDIDLPQRHFYVVFWGLVLRNVLHELFVGLLFKLLLNLIGRGFCRRHFRLVRFRDVSSSVLVKRRRSEMGRSFFDLWSNLSTKVGPYIIQIFNSLIQFVLLYRHIRINHLFVCFLFSFGPVLSQNLVLEVLK